MVEARPLMQSVGGAVGMGQQAGVAMQWNSFFVAAGGAVSTIMMSSPGRTLEQTNRGGTALPRPQIDGSDRGEGIPRSGRSIV